MRRRRRILGLNPGPDWPAGPGGKGTARLKPRNGPENRHFEKKLWGESISRRKINSKWQKNQILTLEKKRLLFNM